MVKFKLTENEIHRILDYLQYVEFTPETLRNEILNLCHNRNMIGLTDFIDNKCEVFFEELEKEDISSCKRERKLVFEFIENLDIRYIVFELKLPKGNK